MKNIASYEGYILESSNRDQVLAKKLIDCIEDQKFDEMKSHLDNGADPNLIEEETGISAMHAAAGYDSWVSNDVLNLIDTLVNAGGDVNVQDEGGHTPIHYVRNINMFMDLVNKGADLMHRAKNGDTILHTFCRSLIRPQPLDLIMEHMKKHGGVGVDDKNNEGKTPLAICYENHPDQSKMELSVERIIARRLIENGADPFLAFGNVINMLKWFKDDDISWMNNERVNRHIDKMKRGKTMFGMSESIDMSNYLLEGYCTEPGEGITELRFFLPEDNSLPLEEAEYRGRKVTLGKPFRTPQGPKKFSVYVKNPNGNVIKVNFGHKGKGGEKTMRIKKSNPARRKSFRARHNCDTPGPRHKARYWSCRFGWPSSGKGAIDKT